MIQRLLKSHALAPQFLRFAMVGGTGVVVGLGALNAAMWLGQGFLAANITAFVIAVSWNFMLNRRLTFSRTNRPVLIQWGEYMLGCLGGAVVNWSVAIPLYHMIPFFHEHYNLAAIAGVAASAVVNFTWSRCMVFRAGGRSQLESAHESATWSSGQSPDSAGAANGLARG